MYCISFAIYCLQVLYDQEDVFVHTAVPASTYYDNIIRGHVRIIEKVRLQTYYKDLHLFPNYNNNLRSFGGFRVAKEVPP